MRDIHHVVTNKTLKLVIKASLKCDLSYIYQTSENFSEFCEGNSVFPYLSFFAEVLVASSNLLNYTWLAMCIIEWSCP